MREETGRTGESTSPEHVLGDGFGSAHFDGNWVGLGTAGWEDEDEDEDESSGEVESLESPAASLLGYLGA